MKTTYMAKPQEVNGKWVVVDAAGQTLGRLASRIASVLRGKHKPTFTPHVDTGDHVIVINAEQVHLTGDKLNKKMYYRHSGYPGAIRNLTAREMVDRKPEKVIELAVWGMLPHNRLGRQLFRKLKVYAGPDHPHAAQMPEPLALKD